MQIFYNVSTFNVYNEQRYKIVTLVRTLELLIYQGFLSSEIFRVLTFNSLLASANRSNKGENPNRWGILMEIKLVQRYSFIVYEKTCIWAC